jgi:hypothetical protein
MAQNQQTCAQCKYYDLNNERLDTSTVPPGAMASCMRYPPHYVIHNYGFPQARRGDWCGEFAPIRGAKVNVTKTGEDK